MCNQLQKKIIIINSNIHVLYYLGDTNYIIVILFYKIFTLKFIVLLTFSLLS